MTFPNLSAGLSGHTGAIVDAARTAKALGSGSEDVFATPAMIGLMEHAAIDVYNTLAVRRGRKIGKGELLVLIPRCLSKQALDGVLEIAGRYEVPVFVATRGQLARRVIRERRPRAVVAVACERDMMTGLRDVAGKLPVLGLTMQLPNGPCRDATIDLGQMETWVKGLVSPQ